MFTEKYCYEKILPGSHCLIQQDTVTKHYNYMGKQQQTNPENKQSRITGSTQVAAVLQHTSIASKSSAITTAQ